MYELMLKHLRRWARTEADPRAYLRGVVLFNLYEARRVVTRRTYGWRRMMRDHLAAIRAAKALLRQGV